jgi:3-oxoadipate enol-lactonase
MTETRRSAAPAASAAHPPSTKTPRRVPHVMAKVENAGARIYWHSVGQGEPLVLIMGLGCSSAMWFRLAPLLARHYRVIMLDNRGVGRTEVDHFVVHRVSTMASDVVAVLAAAGEANAHVLGLSMGGMIAQQLALDHPQCVRSLMLAATNCGGPHAVLAEREVWRLMFSKTSMDPNEALAAMQPYTYAKATPQSRVDEDSVVRLAAYPSTRGYQAQLYGLMGWSSHGRLGQLRVPTLVLHGKEDLLIPPVNGRNLTRWIPHARLVELENASHWIHSDQPEAVARVVRKFITDPKGPLTHEQPAKPHPLDALG